MYSSVVSIVLSLALFVAAQPTFHRRHLHHEHAREAAPQVVTVYVYSNGNPIASSSAAPAAAATSSSAAAAAAGATTSSAPAAASSSGAAAAPASGSGGSFGKGINYSPYTTNGCKSASEVASDLAAYSDCTVVRLFDVDCNGIENVLAAGNFKIMAGVKNVGTVSASISTMISAVGSNWGRIYAVTIGDEQINSGQSSVSDMQGYISQAKSQLAPYFTGIVTTVESQNIFSSQPSLCGVVDAVFANAHPFFDSTCASSNAGSWLTSQISTLNSVCGGKQVIITETGWPWQGSTNGAAVPSTSDQQAALASIQAAVTSNIMYFTAYDSPWMSPGDFGVEQYWGMQHSN